MMGAARSMLAVLAAAAVLYGLQQSRPLYSKITSPIVSAGGMKQRVDASLFAFTVDSVRVARTLNAETFGKSKGLTSSGVWVVVQGEAEAKSETLSLTSGEWMSRKGLRYGLSDRIPVTIEMLAGDAYQPGLPRKVLLVFEVPQDAVAAGTVVITPTKLYPLADEVRVATDATDAEIEPAITLRRNEEGPPWSVLPSS